MLIDHHRHSAAEMVASFAKENRLAKPVGTRSAGEVLGAANFVLSKGYRLRMPVPGWYTWSGQCIEGAGAEPDLVVENTREWLSMEWIRSWKRHRVSKNLGNLCLRLLRSR